MKIAICLSGHLRTYEKCYPYIKRGLLEPNAHHDVDVFISTWDTIQCPNSHTAQTVSGGTEDRVEKSLLDMYNPRAITIHPYEKAQKWIIDEIYQENVEHWSENVARETNMRAVLNMTFIIGKCYHLANIYEYEYDAVVRFRFDIIPMEPIVIDSFDVGLRNIYIEHVPNTRLNVWASDKFAIGSHYAMGVYCNVFSMIPSMFNQGCQFHPETFFAWNLKNSSLNVRNSGINCKVIRDTTHMDKIKVEYMR